SGHNQEVNNPDGFRPPAEGRPDESQQPNEPGQVRVEYVPVMDPAGEDVAGGEVVKGEVTPGRHPHEERHADNQGDHRHCPGEADGPPEPPTVDKGVGGGRRNGWHASVKWPAEA